MELNGYKEDSLYTTLYTVMVDLSYASIGSSFLVVLPCLYLFAVIQIGDQMPKFVTASFYISPI